jgi:glycogen synthase
MTLRILVVTNMYPPHHLGGYELSCRDVVERWREKGHEVTVLTTTMHVPGVEMPEGDNAHRTLDFYWQDYRSKNTSLFARLRVERGNRVAFLEALERVRPDVVSIWHMGAMSQSLLQIVADQDLPMVFVVCDDWLVYATEADLWLRMFTKHPMLGSAVTKLTGLPTKVSFRSDVTAFCFVSDWLRKRAEERSVYPLTRTTVVYSGIEPREFPPRTDQRDWSWRLLTIGRVEDRKGVHIAVEALAHLPADATLDIVGPTHDAYVERLRGVAARVGVGDRVRIVGAEPRDRLAEWYRNADVFLFPVLWDEPFGLVPLEAMACGTPVIATGTGGSAEFLVDGVNCLVVPPRDPVRLADAIRRLAAEPQMRMGLTNAGLATVQELDVDRLAQTLEDWILSASRRFRNGEPSNRPAIRDVLSDRLVKGRASEPEGSPTTDSSP